MPFFYKEDWVDLNNQIVNSYVNGDAGIMALSQRFHNNNFQFMRHGNYEIVVKYNLPGNKQANEFVYKYKNIADFR
jgi:hypothetical protein